MFWEQERNIFVFLSVLLIPNLILSSPHEKVKEKLKAKKKDDLLQEEQNLNHLGDGKELFWTYETICNNKSNNEVCIEIGTPSNAKQFPRTLRIRRNPEVHRSSKKVKRQYDEGDSDYGHHDYGDAKYYEPSSDIENKVQDQNGDEIYYEYDDKENSCKVPQTIKTAEIRCKIWPSFIKCKSYCSYGSTFREGIERIHMCKFKENRWSTSFEECKPFVDCYAKLKSPGSLKCIRNEVLKPPECQISCEMHEDYDELPSQVYHCKASGDWEPPLPFCAERKGLRTVPSPAIREHAEITYPGKQN